MYIINFCSVCSHFSSPSPPQLYQEQLIYLEHLFRLGAALSPWSSSSGSGQLRHNEAGQPVILEEHIRLASGTPPPCWCRVTRQTGAASPPRWCRATRHTGVVSPPHFRVTSASLVPDHPTDGSSISASLVRATSASLVPGHPTHWSSISSTLQGHIRLAGARPPDRLE